MATSKVAPPPSTESPEQVALTAATTELQRLTEARHAAVARVEQLAAILGPRDEHSASQVFEEHIGTVPGTRIGKLFSRGHPPTKPSTATPGEMLRARHQLPAAREALMVSEADLLDARRDVVAARQAWERRQFERALPTITADVDRLLTKAEALATEAARFTTERLLPLLESCPVAGALAEVRLTELEMLQTRGPRLRALLVALQAQYNAPTNGGGH